MGLCEWDNGNGSCRSGFVEMGLWKWDSRKWDSRKWESRKWDSTEVEFAEMDVRGSGIRRNGIRRSGFAEMGFAEVVLRHQTLFGCNNSKIARICTRKEEIICNVLSKSFRLGSKRKCLISG